MGLPGVHSKLWPHQSCSAVSHLPVSFSTFTTLRWSGLASPGKSRIDPKQPPVFTVRLWWTCHPPPIIYPLS